MSISICVEFPGREARLENVKVAKHDNHTLTVHNASVEYHCYSYFTCERGFWLIIVGRIICLTERIRPYHIS